MTTTERVYRLLVGVAGLVLIVAGSTGGVTIPDGHSSTATPLAEEPPAVDGHQGIVQVDRQQADCNYSQLFDAAEESVVVVQSANATGAFGEGSGWIYNISNSTAYVVTNWHVVYNATDYDIQFDGQWREAELVGASSWTDLAVLKVENVPGSATSMELATRPAKPGQPVAALGNPFGLEGSISEGLVSAVDRTPTIPYQDRVNRTIPDTVQTSAAVNPGNSGGPLVNCEGEVLGVNFAGVGLTDAGVNFAVSARMVRTVVPQLIENGTYPTSFLGVLAVPVGPTLAEANNLSVTHGVMVTDVLPGGPGDELQGAPAIHRGTGLPYGGDVILAIDGTRVADQGDLLSYLYLEAHPGETVTLTVLRDGENRTIQATLGARPEAPVQPRQRPQLTPTPTPTPAPPTTTATPTPTETEQPVRTENATMDDRAAGTEEER